MYRQGWVAKEQHGDPDGLQLGSVDGELKLVDFHWLIFRRNPRNYLHKRRGKRIDTVLDFNLDSLPDLASSFSLDKPSR